MPDKKKVINGLECCSQMTGEACRKCRYSVECVAGEATYQTGTAQLAADALALLKEQEPRVLTTDELFYMEHQGVYIERRNSQLYATEPAIVLRTSVCEPSLGGTKYILMRENKLSESRWACDYNKDRRNGWRCWSYRPTEEQREQVKWDDCV